MKILVVFFSKCLSNNYKTPQVAMSADDPLVPHVTCLQWFHHHEPTLVLCAGFCEQQQTRQQLSHC